MFISLRNKFSENLDSLQVRTQLTFIGSKLFSSPLEAMYGLLIFILCKDLNATPLQITLLVSAKPIVALISFYSSLIIKGKPHQLKRLILWSNVISFLPCLLFPLIHNSWFYLLSYALFMMSNRAIIPAWSEILRINVSDPESRGKIFSRASTVNYLIHILIPLLIAPWIDYFPQSWPLIFVLLSAIQFLNCILNSFIKVKNEEMIERQGVEPYRLNSLSAILLEPWKNCWMLMKERVDFRNYQIVFMLGGGGLMLMHPVLPVFFKQTLQLSYTQLTLATSFCKGISFALASPLWAKWLHKVSLHLFNMYVTLFACIFSLFIMGSAYHFSFLYIAYLIYGVMQAGSELSWNLSGLVFSKEKESTLFTGVNVAMVGLRGCFVPFLGDLLFIHSNSLIVFAIGGALCLLGSLYSFHLNRSEAVTLDLLRN